MPSLPFKRSRFNSRRCDYITFPYTSFSRPIHHSMPSKLLGFCHLSTFTFSMENHHFLFSPPSFFLPVSSFFIDFFQFNDINQWFLSFLNIHLFNAKSPLFFSPPSFFLLVSSFFIDFLFILPDQFNDMNQLGPFHSLYFNHHS